MSRIIIKNLPLYLTEDRLKKHFEQKGVVTDVKLMRTRDGRSRKFGFVGYKTEQEAEEAVKFFDSSFIDTARLAVELAKTTKDSTLTSRYDREHHKHQMVEVEEERHHKRQKHVSQEEETDPQLSEFISTMNTRQAAKSWANDDITNQQAPSETAKPAASAALPHDESDNEEDYVKVGASGAVVNADEAEEHEDEPMISLADVPETEEDLAKDEGVTDLDWLRMRRLRMIDGERVSSDKRETTEDVPQVEESYEEEVIEPTESEKTVSKIEVTGRLFLRNLPYSSTEDDYRELFGSFGELEEVHMPIDPRTSKPKGFAYVQFKSSENAVSAFEQLDQTIFQGRILHILAGDVKKEHRLDEFDLKNMPLKKQNELKRRAEASKQQFSWNSLYLNTDAVMETVARKLGVSKSEMINPDSSDGAVQQALAETSVLAGVKEYFESKGVDLQSFSQQKKSDLVILVKNLPFDTPLDEITDLFAAYGELRRVLMPPDGGIAMVVFKNIPQARAAFTKLAFRRFKSSILYLEKGPVGLVDEEVSDANEEVSVKAKEVKANASEMLGTEQAEESTGSVSVFVKNLNFKTTSAELRDAFKALAGFRVAQVKQKADPKNAGRSLSMGFGFVEFGSVEQAATALQAMDGYVLDGHKLQLKLSHRGQEPSQGVASSQKTRSKILVKNIPFEATKKDIQKLFGTFGQLQSVRLPKKFNKSARGFAFAEFISAKEAENAMKALQGTHLLGRRLVLEYAQEDAENAEEEISRMEAKMRKQVTRETLAGMRLSGQQKGLDLEAEEE